MTGLSRQTRTSALVQWAPGVAGLTSGATSSLTASTETVAGTSPVPGPKALATSMRCSSPSARAWGVGALVAVGDVAPAPDGAALPEQPASASALPSTSAPRRAAAVRHPGAMVCSPRPAVVPVVLTVPAAGSTYLHFDRRGPAGTHAGPAGRARTA